MKFFKITVFTICAFILSSLQLSYSDEAKPSNQSTQDDTDMLITKYLKYIETYAADENYNDEEQEITAEDNFFKARYKLIKLGEKAVPRLLKRLKQIKVYHWNYEYEDEKLEEYDEYLYDLLPVILGKIGKPVYPYVLEMLKDDDLYIRTLAVAILHNNRSVPNSLLYPILQSTSYDYLTMLKKMDEDFDKDELDDIHFDESILELYIDELYLATMRFYDSKPKDFINALKSDDVYVRFSALYILYHEFSQRNFDDETREMIRNLTADKMLAIRQLAFELIYQYSDPKAIPMLINALTDEEGDISWYARYTLQHFKPELVVDDLLKFLASKKQESESVFYCYDAIKYLSDIASPKAVPYLIRVLDQDDNLTEASNAIVNCADKVNIPILMKLLNSESKLHVATAIKSLAKLDIDSIKDQVLKLKDDENKHVREAVVTWLAKFGTDDQLEYLLKCMKDENRSIRSKALIASVKLCEDDPKELIKQGLNDKSMLVKSTACVLACKHNTKDLVPIIKDIIQSDNFNNIESPNILDDVINSFASLVGEESILFLAETTLLEDYDLYTSELIQEKFTEIFNDKRFDKNKLNKYMYVVLKKVSTLMYDRRIIVILDMLQDNRDKGFITTLNEILTTSKSVHILHVMNLITEIADKSSIPALIGYFKNPYGNNCFIEPYMIVEALIKIGDKAIVPELFELLKGDWIIYPNEIMEVICALGSKEHLKSIENLYQKIYLDFKTASVNGYSKLADDPIPWLKDHFHKDDDAELKLYIAGNILKYSTSDTNTKTYIKYINDYMEINEDQDEAWDMQAQLHIKSLTPIFLKYSKNFNYTTYQTLFDALCFEGNTGAVSFLSDMLLNYHFFDIRSDVVEGLSKIGDKSCIPALIKAMKTDFDLGVRAKCAEVLGDLGDKSAVPALIEALEDKEEYYIWCGTCMAEMEHENNVRESAIIALAKLGDTSALPHLRKLMKEVDGDYMKKILEMAIVKLELIDARR